MRQQIATAFAAVLFVGSGSAPAFAQAARPATCSTFNAESEPASTFSAGDAVTVRGTGFGPRSVVLVNFQQDTRTVELARATTNDLGAFRVSDAQIPDSVVGGKASIRALDARGSATCNITVKGSGKDEESGLGALYVVWGGLLAVFGGFLGLVTYRRWKADRLREAMEGFAQQTPDPRPSRQRSSARSRFGTDESSTDLPSRGSLDVSEDGFEDEWAFREHVPAGWVRERSRAPTASARRSSRSDFGWSARSDDEDADVWSASSSDDDDHIVAPPRLPDDWDEGRLRTRRQPSEAIERLRREVRSWKRT
jgi:hypothetical protein